MVVVMISNVILQHVKNKLWREATGYMNNVDLIMYLKAVRDKGMEVYQIV